MQIHQTWLGYRSWRYTSQRQTVDLAQPFDPQTRQLWHAMQAYIAFMGSRRRSVFWRTKDLLSQISPCWKARYRRSPCRLFYWVMILIVCSYSEIGTHYITRLALSTRFSCFELTRECMHGEWWTRGCGLPTRIRSHHLDVMLKVGWSDRSGRGLNKWPALWWLILCHCNWKLLLGG